MNYVSICSPARGDLQNSLIHIQNIWLYYYVDIISARISGHYVRGWIKKECLSKKHDSFYFYIRFSI